MNNRDQTLTDTNPRRAFLARLAVAGLVVFHGRIRGNTLEGFPCARKHIMSSCLPSSV